MDYIYKGFGVELSITTDEVTSNGLWGLTVYGAKHAIIHYEADKYEISGDAASAAEKWIDNYFSWTPMTETAKQAIKLQEILKTIEDQLNRISEPPYSKYYEKIVTSGLSDLSKILLCAYGEIADAMEVNQKVIEAIKAHPREDLNAAISMHLQRRNHD